MADTAFSGPLVVFGQSPYAPLEYNPDLGSSLFWGGAAILDPRIPFTYTAGQQQAQQTFGWLGFDNVTTQSVVPYTKTTGAIVTSANATSATLTLVSASSTTSGVYITPSITRSDTGVVDSGVSSAGLVALDAFTQVTASVTNGVLTVTANSYMPITPGMVITATTGTVSSGTAVGTVITGQLTASATGAVGLTGTYSTSNSSLTATSGTVSLAIPNPQASAIPSAVTGTQSVYLWNPTALIGRAVAVTAASGATATTATISSYDVYGYPMVEIITLTAGSQVSGKKAHKYIRSVVLNAADSSHAYSVDTVDLYGFPLRSDSFADISVNYASSLTGVTAITAATGYTNADLRTATATTGDVRGTFSSFTASTGANKMVVRQSPQPYMVGSVTGLYGNTQYTNF